MRVPHFITLARLDQERFVSACRHGIVHLNWGRATVRLGRDRFRKLSILLDRAVGRERAMSARDGELGVVVRPDGKSEVQFGNPSGSWAGDTEGSVVLVVGPEELLALQQALRESVQRLDKVLASGIWDRDATEPGPPTDPLSELGRFPFSHN